MTYAHLFFTLEDLPTLRKCAKITRQLADDGAGEVPDSAGRAFVEAMMRYSAEFHERIVRELERLEHEQQARRN